MERHRQDPPLDQVSGAPTMIGSATSISNALSQSALKFCLHKFQWVWKIIKLRARLDWSCTTFLTVAHKEVALKVARPYEASWGIASSL